MFSDNTNNRMASAIQVARSLDVYDIFKFALDLNKNNNESMTNTLVLNMIKGDVRLYMLSLRQLIKEESPERVKEILRVFQEVLINLKMFGNRSKFLVEPDAGICYQARDALEKYGFIDKWGVYNKRRTNEKRYSYALVSVLSIGWPKRINEYFVIPVPDDTSITFGLWEGSSERLRQELCEYIVEETLPKFKEAFVK